MQENTINLTVDTDGLGSTDAVVLKRLTDNTTTANARSTYKIDGVHSLVNTAKVQLYATYPKASGGSLGNLKYSLKVTLDRDVLNDAGETVKRPQIFEVSSSDPVGVSLADAMEIRQIAMAILDDPAVMTKLVSDGEV